MVAGFDVDSYAKSEVTSISFFNKLSIHNNQVLIEMPFAKEIILNKEQKKQLQERVIVKIELVYTRFKTSEKFNQTELNKKRLLELKKLVPEVFDFPVWEYQLISQNNGNSREECSKMFHGFIITFRPLSTDAYAQQESDYVKQLVSNLSKIDSLAKDTTPKPYHIKTRWENGYVYDTIWGEEKKIDFYPPPPPNPYLASLKEDSTVLNAFSRNKNWTNFIVVTDATGSMSPYYTQVLTWLRQQLNNENARLFVFFNDGDRKPSDKKLLLETGGIYVTTERSYEMVSQTINKCISGGAGGGETKENDVEAMLLGLKHYPEAKNIVLIADNYEKMRDYEFMDKITIPVHIFLCGADRFINLQYLDLARVTKGSVHTKNEDIYNLYQLKEGEVVTIENRDYMLKNGVFTFYNSSKSILYN
ncbi:MAG: hypothetical protein CVT95_03615 [Bacteroidetes bacterium HGW-Bacteroidetes-12]|nr:MAG: hypothetical protein CVT95_03615 [Bacteroidetes bacterium HGW-Bacteroidetes-12]